MRILVAHDVPARRTGGMSRIMGFIHDRLVAAGHHVDYLHGDDVPAGLPGTRRFAFPAATYAHATRAFRDGRAYDLLNIHEPSALPSILGRHRMGNPGIVVTTHGVERRAWELALDEGRRGRGGPSLKTRVVYPLSSLWQSRFGLTHADHVFCLNDEDRTFLVDRFRIAAGRVTRICPGADPIYATAADQRDYAGATRLLFAGTWRKNKGIQDLVPAFIELRRRHPHVRLVVLGAGVPDEVVRAEFPEESRDAVECITTRSEEDTAAAFARADIFVLPSLFEGTPLTLLEAMASGLPILTTAVCGMKDVIEHGRNGLLVPIRSPEALVREAEALIERRELRRQLGVAARHDAQHRYTWDHSAELVGETYEQILHQHRHALAS